jgi:hypothetical protein
VSQPIWWNLGKEAMIAMITVQTTEKTTVQVAWSESELRATLEPMTPVPAHKT